MKHKSKILIIISILVMVSISCATLASSATSQPPEIVEEVVQVVEATESTTGQTEVSTEPRAAINFVDQDSQLVELFQNVNPGVVAIRVLAAEGTGLGSGFVIDEEGHIVTNYHVVEDANELEVDFPSGLKVRGEVIGLDPDSDLAVIKVDVPADELHPLPLGDSDTLKTGQMVVAIGNPHGLTSTMTTGIVSAIGRTITSLREAPGGGAFTAGGIIQTDAAINPGNSGGPLINLNGEVIGVNESIRSSSFDITGQPVNTGIGFAVPVNIIKLVVPELIENGSYPYPYLGIRSLDEITLFQQEQLELPQASGVYVTDVTDGSPADEAGLQAGNEFIQNTAVPLGGDLIIEVDGESVYNFNDLITYLILNRTPGDTVTLTVLRDGESINLDLTLGERP